LRTDAESLRAPQFRLPAIATIESRDPGTRQRLEALTLTVFGAGTGAVQVSRADVQRAVEWALPDLRGDIRWRGAEFTSVQVAASGDDFGGLEAVAREALAGDRNAPLRRTTQLRPRLVPKGDIGLIALESIRDLRLGPSCQSVAMEIDRRPFDLLTVCFAMQATTGPVAANDGGRLSPAPQAVAGRAPVAAARAQIRAHDEVRVRVVGPAVSIDTMGIALNGGEAGSRIRVLNPRSREEFVGIAGADATVVVKSF
jgi:hypothetical protein